MGNGLFSQFSFKLTVLDARRNLVIHIVGHGSQITMDMAAKLQTRTLYGRGRFQLKIPKIKYKQVGGSMSDESERNGCL